MPSELHESEVAKSSIPLPRLESQKVTMTRQKGNGAQMTHVPAPVTVRTTLSRSPQWSLSDQNAPIAPKCATAPIVHTLSRNLAQETLPIGASLPPTKRIFRTICAFRPSTKRHQIAREFPAYQNLVMGGIGWQQGHLVGHAVRHNRYHGNLVADDVDRLASIMIDPVSERSSWMCASDH